MTDKVREALEAAREALRADNMFTLSVKIAAALAALDAETPAAPADVGEEPVAWRWKQIGRTDADAWSYQFGHPQMSDTLYVTEPVYSATALERFAAENIRLVHLLNTATEEFTALRDASTAEIAALMNQAEKAERERDEARADHEWMTANRNKWQDAATIARRRAESTEAKLAEARKVIERAQEGVVEDHYPRLIAEIRRFLEETK